MAIETKLLRGNGHPFGTEDGWDGMFIWADSEDALNHARQSAEGKFWRLWVSGAEIGTGRWVAYFYKPSGKAEAWVPDNPALDFWRGKPWGLPARRARA